MSLPTGKTRTTKPFGGVHSSATFKRRERATGKWVVQPGFPSAGKLLGWNGDQYTRSEGHPWPPGPGNHGDIGGDFFTIKRYGQCKPAVIGTGETQPVPTGFYDMDSLQESVGYRCPVSLSAGKAVFPSSLASSTSQLEPWGAKAASLVRPTAAEVDLSTALGELLNEGLPSVVGSSTWAERTLRARNAGDEYLNVQFGWLPLVSDIQKLAATVGGADAVMQQYNRDQGRSVRRSYQFDTIQSESETLLGNNKAPESASIASVGGFGSSTNGAWFKKSTVKIDRWFSGAFIYGSPMRSSHVKQSASLAETADRLLGLSLSPDVLWNLTPWSWALDWAFNIGDVLSYASDVASQGLVMSYGYIMEHTVHTDIYTLVGATRRGKSLGNLSTVLVTETKQRRAANPFGFGLTWDGLSAAQQAILAALGLSRGR